MSAAEYASWQEMNERIGEARIRAKAPCRDCPLWFRTLSESEGCCNDPTVKPAAPGRVGRPRLPETGVYAVDRARQRKRAAMAARRYRERQRARALQTAAEAVTISQAGAVGVTQPPRSPQPR